MAKSKESLWSIHMLYTVSDYSVAELANCFLASCLPLHLSKEINEGMKKV